MTTAEAFFRYMGRMSAAERSGDRKGAARARAVVQAVSVIEGVFNEAETGSWQGLDLKKALEALRLLSTEDRPCFLEFLRRWPPDQRYLLRDVAEGGLGGPVAGNSDADTHASNPCGYARLDDLEENPPPAREWWLHGWVPAGSVTALLGDGGVGKTLLMQQLLTCGVLGVSPFAGTAIAIGPVLALLCEDDEQEIRRRQQSILRHLVVSAAAGAEGLHLMARAGMANTLVSFGPDRRPMRTAFFGLLESEIDRIRPRAVVLDNVAQIFAGNENDRFEVTAFCNELTGLAKRFGCAVILLGHVAKTEGSEYSGSTAWNGAVRSRLWLRFRDDGLRELSRAKSNYSDRGASVAFDWQDGALGEVDQADDTGAARAKSAEAVVLAGLDRLTERQIACSHIATARTFLPRLMAQAELLNGVRPEVAARALASLIDRGDIEPNRQLAWKKPDRHPASGLARRRVS